MTHSKFMQLAIKKAKEGIAKGQSPFGACIIKDNEIISVSHNTVWEEINITNHAEINAIKDACKKLNTIDLSDCIIYSTCEPCPMCLSACHWAKISKIIYGASIEDAKNIGFSELTVSCEKMKEIGNSPVEIEGNFLKEECLELFEIWLERGDKKTY